MLNSSGRSAAWLAHLPWEQGVGGSNPLAPTNIPPCRTLHNLAPFSVKIVYRKYSLHCKVNMPSGKLKFIMKALSQVLVTGSYR